MKHTCGGSIEYRPGSFGSPWCWQCDQCFAFSEISAESVPAGTDREANQIAYMDGNRFQSPPPLDDEDLVALIRGIRHHVGLPSYGEDKTTAYVHINGIEYRVEVSQT